jgi:hypothetical protein
MADAAAAAGVKVFVFSAQEDVEKRSQASQPCVYLQAQDLTYVSICCAAREHRAYLAASLAGVVVWFNTCWLLTTER